MDLVNVQGHAMHNDELTARLEELAGILLPALEGNTQTMNADLSAGYSLLRNLVNDVTGKSEFCGERDGHNFLSCSFHKGHTGKHYSSYSATGMEGRVDHFYWTSAEALKMRTEKLEKARIEEKASLLFADFPADDDEDPEFEAIIAQQTRTRERNAQLLRDNPGEIITSLLEAKLKPKVERNCCCVYGAAVSGEYPEFSRPCCEIHFDNLMGGTERCKRHTKEGHSWT